MDGCKGYLCCDLVIKYKNDPEYVDIDKDMPIDYDIESLDQYFDGFDCMRSLKTW